MILLLKYGGLGDSLAFSTLPELCHKNNQFFFLSSQCKNLFRNNEIFDLVWKNNPYFKGFSDGKPDAGNIHISDSGRINENDCEVQCFERIYFNKSENKYPKIYYKPKYIEKYKNYTIVDLTSFALRYFYKNDIEIVKNKLSEILPNDFHLIKFSNINNKNLLNINEKNELIINSIYDYCDLINSCNKVVCFNSGTNSLSSAIKQDRKNPEIDVISFKRFYNTFVYSNTNCILL